MSKLAELQQTLKCPKNQFNKFGGYKYRNCEDIVEAFKKVLAPVNGHLLLSDEIVEVGGRVYVKATATVVIGDESYSTVGFAREAEVKKGMDDSQITGTASSYARKYALNGLGAIDDTKDADTNEHHQAVSSNEFEEKVKEHRATIDAVKNALAENNYSAAIEAWYELSRDDQMILWKAPSKGGPFTTEERNKIKSDEWGAERKAMMGGE